MFPSLIKPAHVLALLCLTSALTAQAAGPSVTAVIDSSETVVGRPIHIEIKVAGTTGANPPSTIEVDGLDIRYSGQSQLIEGRNFSFSYSSVFTYTVMPLRAGAFTIPPQTIRAGGSTLQTPVLTLNVADNGGRAQRSPRASGRKGSASDPIDPSKAGFVEFIVPKTSAYVGEMIPVEVRIGFNTRMPVESLGSGVQVGGQGFTTQKFPDPRQTIETINGHSYQMFIFKSAIAVVRPGKIEIGPVEITPVVRVPRAGNGRQALPRDLFDMDDPFFNSFFNDPAFQPSTPQEITLKSEAHSLEIKPLPANAPPGFAGAVGSFTLKADANPKTVQVGDPTTVTATITGRGNFDRVTAPELSDEQGWHKYPPTAKFRQDDDVGISGTKIFETALSPNEKKSAVPPLIFSFFDPLKETYVTLRSEPLPLAVQGGASAPAVATSGGTPSPNISATPAATTPKPADILYQMTDEGRTKRTFVPLYMRPAFWAAQLAPLAGLLAFLFWKRTQTRRSDQAAARIAALQHEAADLQRKLRRDETAPEKYFAEAARALQIKTALVRGVNPDTVDAAMAAETFRADEATRVRIQQLFERSDELRYSGANGNGAALTENRRREVLELIEGLRK